MDFFSKPENTTHIVMDKGYEETILEGFNIWFLRGLNLPDNHVIKKLKLKVDPYIWEKISSMVDFQPINTGKITDEIIIEENAGALLPMLRIPEDNVVKTLLIDYSYRYFADFIARLQDQSIHIGRATEEIKLWNIPFFMFLNLKIPEDNVVKRLLLSLDGYYYDLGPINGIENKPIHIGRVTEEIGLYDYAIDLLPKIIPSADNSINRLILASKHIDNILERGDNSINIGKVTGEIILRQYVCFILPKLKIEEISTLTRIFVSTMHTENLNFSDVVMEKLANLIARINGISIRCDGLYPCLSSRSKRMIQ
eukprot:GHVP01008255.1.p1 GENE.GHVP01008255.1~~GHVP01008255.1.p1  ORF type:complete len:311 (+),score=22.96 GHVP01008255.1:325-1257(+)